MRSIRFDTLTEHSIPDYITFTLGLWSTIALSAFRCLVPSHGAYSASLIRLWRRHRWLNLHISTGQLS